MWVGLAKGALLLTGPHIFFDEAFDRFDLPFAKFACQLMLLERGVQHETIKIAFAIERFKKLPSHVREQGLIVPQVRVSRQFLNPLRRVNVARCVFENGAIELLLAPEIAKDKSLVNPGSLRYFF